MFKDFKVGQRVLYTGETSYGDMVKRSPGTIVTIGNSLTILMDESKEPYLSNDGVTNIPAKCYANVSEGDLKTREKKMERVYD